MRPTELFRLCWDRIRPDTRTIQHDIVSGTVDQELIPTVDSVGTEYWDYESAESTQLYEIGVGAILGSWSFSVESVAKSYFAARHEPTVNDIKQLDQLQVDMEKHIETKRFVRACYDRFNQHVLADVIVQLYAEQVETEPITSCFRTVELDTGTRMIDVPTYDGTTIDSSETVPDPDSISRDTQEIEWQRQRQTVSPTDCPVQEQTGSIVTKRANDALQTIVDSCQSEQQDEDMLDTAITAIEQIDRSDGYPDFIVTDDSIYADDRLLQSGSDSDLFVYNCTVGIDTHDLVGSDNNVTAIVVDRDAFGIETVVGSIPAVEAEHAGSHRYTINTHYSYVPNETSMCRYITNVA